MKEKQYFGALTVTRSVMFLTPLEENNYISGDPVKYTCKQTNDRNAGIRMYLLYLALLMENEYGI